MFFPILKNAGSKLPRSVGIDRLLWKEDDPTFSSACQQRKTIDNEVGPGGGEGINICLHKSKILMLINTTES